MKTVILRKILVFICGFSIFTACDFLDKLPDNRTEIDSKQKVQQILVSAYSDANYGMIAEISSDNMIDNNSPDDAGYVNKRSTLNRQYDEVFAWEDVVSSNAQDSPYSIWAKCYKAIASTNAALEAIEKLEKEGIDMDAEKGEALMSRAYHHFILVNIFGQAYKDSIKSLQDLGVTYMMEPEKVVAGQYKRLSVTETYNHIIADFEAGIDLIDESYYSVVKYHFNMKAAHAFGARLYLYLRKYDKVIYHANKVLGADQNSAAPLLFDAYNARYNTSYPTSEIYEWIDAKSPSNLLILSTNSEFPFSLNLSYNRYAFNRQARTETLRSSGPNWSGTFPGFNLWSTDSNLGSFVAKFYYLFEYTDKNAGIGFVHAMRREFTTNETLLCRAEAYLFKGEIDNAVKDLDTWSKGYLCTTTLTRSNIESFYTPARSLVKPLNSSLMSENFIVSSAIEPYVQCILHFRRIETLHDGLRWFDIKRYGIEIKRVIGSSATELFLPWNDDRRAIQLPQDVIISGFEPNPRMNVGSSGAVEYSPGYCNESALEVKRKIDNQLFTSN